MTTALGWIDFSPIARNRIKGFLIDNRVSKLPVLVIEVDGFAYHHRGTRQAERDKLKDSILSKYGIPLLRLSTAGSNEVDKIEKGIRENV